jgi:GrpB-like predicted nucleotidyltransferase (UPF0157 family)
MKRERAINNNYSYGGGGDSEQANFREAEAAKTPSTCLLESCKNSGERENNDLRDRQIDRQTRTRANLQNTDDNNNNNRKNIHAFRCALHNNPSNEKTLTTVRRRVAAATDYSRTSALATESHCLSYLRVVCKNFL